MRKEVIEIEVKNSDAIKDVQKLEKSFDNLDNSVQSVNKNLDSTEKESKKVSEGFEEVTKNGGAIAILDQFTGGLATRVRDAFEATKLFNFSLKGTRTALIATGIGAFIVALGVVVAYWDDISDAITGANKNIEIQNDLIDANIEILNGEYKVLEAKEKLLIAEGKSVKEVRKEKEKLLKLQLQENENLLNNLKLQLQKEKSVAKEVGFFESLKIKAKGFLSPAGQATAIAELIVERSKTTNEIEKQITDAETRALSLQTLLVDLNKPQETKETKDKNTKSNFRGEEVTPLETLQIGSDKELELIDTTNSQKIFADKVTQDKIAQYREEIRQEDLQREKSVNAAKLGLAKNTLNNISNAVDENSKVGKAAAAAAALINTYQGITAELATKTATPFGFALKLANIAATTAIGFKSVKDILATNPKSSNGASGTSSGGGRRAQAPNFNIVGQSGTNQLAGALSGQQKEPVKAYVVGSEVTTQQSLDRNIINNASFG